MTQFASIRNKISVSVSRWLQILTECRLRWWLVTIWRHPLQGRTIPAQTWWRNCWKIIVFTLIFKDAADKKCWILEWRCYSIWYNRQIKKADNDRSSSAVIPLVQLSSKKKEVLFNMLAKAGGRRPPRSHMATVSLLIFAKFIKQIICEGTEGHAGEVRWLVGLLSVCVTDQLPTYKGEYDETVRNWRPGAVLPTERTLPAESWGGSGQLGTVWAGMLTMFWNSIL